MKHQKLLLILGLQCLVASLFSQISFSNKINLLTPEIHHSGVAIAIIDMNGDGRDDIVRLDQGTELNIQYQTSPDQSFGAKALGALPGFEKFQWGICTGDIDNNGFSDILTGGSYDGIKVLNSNAEGTDYNLENMTQPGTFVQGVNFADINNDGWLDAFVCHDDGISRIFGNNGDGTFTYQPLWLNLATAPASDNSGNYGSVWSDIDNDGDVDLYIAHCRQGVNDPADPRRINQLFLNNGDGTYSQDLANVSGLRIGAQSWTADFGDIDNDGDFDCFITNHDVSSQLLENDGAGHFTDITATAGMQDFISGLPIQGVFRDFDNDGYVDILVAGQNQYIFKNNGDKTFTEVEGIIDNNAMESFAVGDLNSDGFQDIYGAYALVFNMPSSIPDALWMNNGNNNHFFGLNLRGIQSNRSGVGAKVQLFSSLGIQTREVRSGESYGISNSLQIHFGLGQVETIDSVVINWPSGVHDVIYNPIRDQYITFAEGGCLVSAISMQALGATTFCSGDSVSLEGPSGFNYQWNTGESTQSITATEAGEYKVTVTTTEGCTAVSNSIVITVDPVQIPQIVALGDSVFCAGGALVLSAPISASYLWNTGATTQNISVSDAGLYTVTTQGLCSMFSSAPYSVTVLAAPTPMVSDAAVSIDGTATLMATGSMVQWYEAQNSAAPLLAGNIFSTPVLTESTTYWVSNTTVYDQPSQFVGMVDHQGTDFGANSYIGGLYFDCFSPFTLSKTKVYANTAGNRKVDVLKSNGELLASKTVFIPVGTTVIDLDLNIPIGTDLLLTTDATVNQSVLGSSGPQLRRSNDGIAFPYEIPGIVSIKNSTFDQSRYYYFYDWELDYPSYICESERVPVTATVTISATNTPGWAAGVQVFPNPSSGIVKVTCGRYDGGSMMVTLKNVQGASVQTRVLDVSAGSFEFTTDLRQLASGIYWLELAGDSGVVRRKVVLQ